MVMMCKERGFFYIKLQHEGLPLVPNKSCNSKNEYST